IRSSAVGFRWEQTRPSANATRSQHPAFDLAWPLEPHWIGPHPHDCVGVKQGDQRRQVVALEGSHILGEEPSFSRTEDSSVWLTQIAARECGPCALMRAVHGR